MFPYHNNLKKRIRNHEYSHNTIDKNYKNSGQERMILHFTTHPKTQPIKPEKYAEYLDLINQ